MAAQFENVYGVRIDRKVDFDKVLISKESQTINKRRTVDGNQMPTNAPLKSSLRKRGVSLGPRFVTFDLPSASPTSPQSPGSAASSSSAPPPASPTQAPSAPVQSTSASSVPGSAASAVSIPPFIYVTANKEFFENE